MLRRGQGERVKVTAAEFVLVAVDDNGRPRRLPETDECGPAEPGMLYQLIETRWPIAIRAE